MGKISIDGADFDFDAAVELMDDEVREEMHANVAPGATEQDFVDAYRAAHVERFGEDFVIN